MSHHRNQHREARALKRGGAELIVGRIAAGLDFVAQNDEPEPRHTRPDCCACSVCGGHRAPLGAPLCEACRQIARNWSGENML